MPSAPSHRDTDSSSGSRRALWYSTTAVLAIGLGIDPGLFASSRPVPPAQGASRQLHAVKLAAAPEAFQLPEALQCFEGKTEEVGSEIGCQPARRLPEL